MLKLIPLHELMKIRNYPQYLVEPFRYYSSPLFYSTGYRTGFTEVEAYLLCYKGKCIAMHLIGSEMIIDAENEEDIAYVIDSLLKSPSLTEHEILGLSKFFMVDKSVIEEIMYNNWLRSKIEGKRVAILRNTAYVLYDGIYPLGETDRHTIAKMGGIIVKSPVTEIIRYIRSKITPDFYVTGRGGVIFCNIEEKRCLCFPVEDIIDLLTRKMEIKKENAERWMRKGRAWYIWIKGDRYVSPCPPRREPKEGGEEETLYLEYITR
jgi:hypothetical protein